MSDERAARASAERASARREAAMRLHPDRGGDPAEFDRAMKSFEVPPPVEGTPPPSARASVPARRTRAARAAKSVRTTSKSVVADVRRRLPRSFPGSRRYGRL